MLSADLQAVDSFAVVDIKGKQYKVASTPICAVRDEAAVQVSAEDLVMAEKLDAEVGSKVVFDQVLLMGQSGGSSLSNPLALTASSIQMVLL